MRSVLRDLRVLGVSTALALAASPAGCSTSAGQDAGASKDAGATGGASGPRGGSGGTSSQGAGGLAGASATGGQGGQPAVGSGGSTGSGGAVTGSGGAVTGSGGAVTGSGGAVTGSGGAMTGSGGATGMAGSSGGASGAAGKNGSAGAGWSSTFPTFAKHTVASFSSGYAVAIADVDHDGKPDIVALSSGTAGLVWFKNPSWQKYTIVATGAKNLIYMAADDVNGDGRLDFAVASDFSMTDTTGGGTISWAEAPADPTQSQEWPLHKIGAIPTSHRLRWADLDGDGKKELIVLPIFGMGSTAPAYAGAVQLTAFTVPSDPVGGVWTSKVLDNQHLEVAHGLAVVDWDGDKAQDLLTAANDGVDLFRPGLNLGDQHVGSGDTTGQAPSKGSSEVGLGSLAGARFIATIDPWHGTDAVVYTPGASATALWNRLDLGSDFTHGHGLGVADFNGDGYDEFVAGGGQGTMAQIIYQYDPTHGTWTKIPLDTGGVAVSGIDVGDLDGDGDIDIVSIGTSPTNNVVWYENQR
jgi:hypothetical protein